MDYLVMRLAAVGAAAMVGGGCASSKMEVPADAALMVSNAARRPMGLKAEPPAQVAAMGGGELRLYEGGFFLIGNRGSIAFRTDQGVRTPVVVWVAPVDGETPDFEHLRAFRVSLPATGVAAASIGMAGVRPVLQVDGGSVTDVTEAMVPRESTR